MSRFIDYYGYENSPPREIKYDQRNLLSLDQALRPLYKRIGNLYEFAREAKENCNYLLYYGLTRDESAAIYLYSEDQFLPSFRRDLNTALRSGVESKIEPWLDFIKLFYSALKKLPKIQGTVWRLVHVDDARKFRASDVVYSWCILSCSSTTMAIEKYRLPYMVFCSIDVRSGIDIGEEILILPGTPLYVREGYDNRSGHIPMIQLKELPNDSSVHEPSIPSSDPKSRYVTSCHIDVNATSMDHQQSSRRRPYLVIELSNGGRYELIGKKRIDRHYAVFYTRNGNRYFNVDADLRVNGTGNCRWLNGDEYEGSFKDGKRSGFGILITTDRYIYKGNWSNDVIHGEGWSSWANTFQYEGVHSSGRITGDGYFSSASGDCYIGYLRDAKATGKGERRWSNGDRYKGDFKDDKKHGYGHYTFATGGSYVGHWFEDKMNGSGVLRWPSGTEYSGTFNNGKRDGEGTLHFKNGCVQHGWWQNDTYCGPIQQDSR